MRNWGEHKNNTSSVKGIFLNRFKERYKNLTVQLKSKERIWFIFNLTLISFLKQLYSLFLHTCLCVCVCIFPCLRKVKHLTKGSRGVQEMCCCSRSMRHLAQGLDAVPAALGYPWGKRRASPPADGAASPGSQHEPSSQRCVLTHASHRA